MNRTSTKMVGWTWAVACAGLLAACDTNEGGAGEGGSGGGGGGEETDLGVGGGAGGGLSGGIPAGGEPSGGIPAGGEPSGGIPAGGEPSGGIPAGGEPSGGIPAGGEPAGGAPAGGEPAGGAPAGGEPPPQCTLDVECPQPGAPNCSGVCLDGVCVFQCEEPPPQCDEERACPPNAVCRDGVCVPVEPCACQEIFAPVCGADGQTYGNACEAECAGVEIVAMGECGAGVCPDPNDPAVTYVSDDPEMCQVIRFRCERGQQAFSNECGCGCIDAPVCICPAIDAPVCGEDGRTYGNACEAECAAVPVAYDGECRNEGCICPAIYAPVCGEDGRTYGNDCEAACVMVPVAYDGECQGAGACPDPNDPDVRYVADTPEQCQLVRFFCRPDEELFSNECGCGCVRIPARACADGEVRRPDGECRPACRGDQECRRGTVCNAAEVCLSDPNCPMCDVCAGWCVAAVQ